jgi:hypothetical protein
MRLSPEKRQASRGFPAQKQIGEFWRILGTPYLIPSIPLKLKNRPISTLLSEAAFIHIPLLQRSNILRPPGKAFKQLQ